MPVQFQDCLNPSVREVCVVRRYQGMDVLHSHPAKVTKDRSGFRLLPAALGHYAIPRIGREGHVGVSTHQPVSPTSATSSAEAPESA